MYNLYEKKVKVISELYKFNGQIVEVIDSAYDPNEKRFVLLLKIGDKLESVFDCQVEIVDET